MGAANHQLSSQFGGHGTHMGGANVFFIRIFKGRRGDRAGANPSKLKLSALLSELNLSLVAGDRAGTKRDTARMPRSNWCHVWPNPRRRLPGMRENQEVFGEYSVIQPGLLRSYLGDARAAWRVGRADDVYMS